MAALRFGLAIALGLVTTFALFWIMQALVGVEAEMTEGGPPTTVEFVRLRRDTAPPPPEREPPKRQKPEQPPPPPDMDITQRINPNEATSEIASLVDTESAIEEATTLGGGGGDTSSTPLVRVEPDYPPRAKQRGIEGWVIVQFTITPIGTVDNPSVIEANPPGIFEQSALRAVRRWRFNPQVVNGKPVARTTKTRIRFEL